MHTAVPLMTSATKALTLSGVPNCYLSRGYLHSLLDVLGGIFYPLFVDLVGTTPCSKLPALQKP